MVIIILATLTEATLLPDKTIRLLVCISPVAFPEELLGMAFSQINSQLTIDIEWGRECNSVVTISASNSTSKIYKV